ncbi:MAG: hypothetical protein AB7G28_02100 [Pirellulales bacterium]
MLRRILYSTSLFLAIAIAYQAYALVVVPWVEPELALKPSRPTEDPDIPRDGIPSVNKYQRLLAAYFPADHWSQTQPPIVIENDAGTVMFVLDEYQRTNEGGVRLSHFAFLIFPTPRQLSPTPPRNAIILEAPQGARLQFDKNFRPERGEIGSIQHGEFPGKITIRSDMNEPGPADDLVIETSDLEMNSKLLFTRSEVRFRLGPNVGGGRELEIRLLEEEPSKAKGGMNISSVDSLEIFHDVRLRVHVNAGSLLPGDKPKTDDKSTSAIKLGDPTQPPVEVTCQGPFHFDFIKYVASFDQEVEVWQVNPNGPADQLTADRLDLCFARKQESSPPESEAAETASRQRDDIRWLEPDRIVADGHPVVITSPARDAEVRGTSVQLMLRQRRVAVEGGQDVSIRYGPNVLQAPQILYQHPAEDAQTKIGTFRASGPGSLSYLPDPNKPDQVFQANWQASVELGRHNGQPVLSIAGRPSLGVTNVGLLTADQVKMYFREVESDGKTQPIPDRMNADGQVEINSRELLARTSALAATFNVEEPAAAAVAEGAAGTGAAGGGFAQFNLQSSAGPAARQYEVRADNMQLAIALRGKRAAPTTLACNGHVNFHELPGPQLNGEQPFEVTGGQLTAERLDSAALVTVRGVATGTAPDPNATAEELLAQISARGMTVHASDVKLDVGQNRLWIDGPGVADMLLKRDLSGKGTATPTPLELRWQRGLAFDGRTIHVEGNVQIDGPDDHLRCEIAEARLTSNVNFRERVDQNAIELLEVECRSRVTMDHKSRDEVGITSHERMELEMLKVNQQTGDISGSGPGIIRSSHYASELPGLGTPGATQAPVASDNAKLHFLRVDFQQGLKGNMINREITFLTRVRAVYGPIDAWEQELDANRPELLPPDTLMITSEELRVNEDPVQANHRTRDLRQAAGTQLGPLQLSAMGNVRIDGQSPKQGVFAATADRASYTQIKEQFILEGSGRVPATLWHRNPVTGQQIDNSAAKITYNRITGEAVWDGFQSIELTPGAGAGGAIKSAIGPGAVRQ